MLVPHMLAQITAISAAVSTPGTLIRLLLRMNPLMRIVLRLRRRRVVAEPTLVLSLTCVRGLVILELLLRAERSAARFGCRGVDVRADVGMVLAMSARDVPVEFAAVLESCVAAFPAANECLGA